jgi:DNA polymerase-4
MSRVIFHVDMDAFFASIEQRSNPEYRGMPLIVGAPPDQRGVVCAASYEARKFKVRSAMPSRTAFRLCPQGIFVRPRMDVYRAESEQIMSIFSKFTSQVERVSVDEAYLDMSGLIGDKSSPDAALESSLPLAREIKSCIQRERGLSASIGVAANKFLAKLGSDFQKPNGLTLIRETEKFTFLKPLSVRCIHGVGPVTADALEAKGLYTIGDLQTTTHALESVVGSWADTLRQLAFGEDSRPINTDRERKSVSAENTFLVDTEDRPTLRAALAEMAGDVAHNLETHKSGALTLQVKVRYSDFKTLTRQIQIEEPIHKARDIYRLACHLLATHKLVTRPLRLLGIGTSRLVPLENEQMKQLLLPL